MMKTTWKRVLSALLTVCMIASLLIVPAAATPEDGKYVFAPSGLTTGKQPLGTNIQQGTENYFTIRFGDGSNDQIMANTTSFASITGGDNFTATQAFRPNGASTGKVGRVITFTPNADVTSVKIWWTGVSGNAGGYPAIWQSANATENDDSARVRASGTALWSDSGNVSTGTEGHVSEVTSLELKAGTEYAIGCLVKKIDICRIEVVEKAADPNVTATPNFTSKVAKIADGKVAFTLTAAPSAETTYALYASEEAAEALATATSSSTTVEFSYATAGTVYVAATQGELTESARVALTIRAADSVDTVSLNKTSVTLDVGATEALTATTTPSETSDTITWSSNNEDAATVTGGTVTAVKPGVATIAAKANDYASATATVVVNGTTEAAGPAYTFNADQMAPAEGTATVKYDSYYTVLVSADTYVAVGSRSWEGDDALTTANYLRVTKKPTASSGLKFTTQGEATVKIWWVAGGANDRQIAIYNTESMGAAAATTSESNVAQNATFVSELSLTGAGTYVIGSNQDSSGTNYIGQVIVTETATEPPATKTDLSTKTVTVDKTAPVVGDTITASVADVTATDVDFIWTVGGTEIAAKTATYTVAAADMGKVITVKAQAKDGSETYENATAVVTLTAVEGKTMTVSAENVTKTYDGVAATVTVTCSEDSADITYCATENGTYTATQPEMKNANTYTVYFKATAAGCKDAADSATVTINKATPTITVEADLEDDITAEATTVTFIATGVPTDSATKLTGLCDKSDHGSFEFAMVDGKLKGVNAVAANTEATAKTHTVSFTWAGDDNYNAATIADVVLTQVAYGTVGTTKATGLAVNNGFASKGVTATATDADGVSITIDEAAILAAFAADKAAFQGNAVQHGNDAYIPVSFDAPTGFDKTTWTVQQLVNDAPSSTNPWKLDGTDASNELNVGEGKIIDWFCVLKGVNGDAPTMPDANTYKMTYKFYDGSNALQAIYTYTVKRAVTPAQKIGPLAHIFDATNSTAAVTAIGDKATVTTGGDVAANGFFVAKSSNNPVSGINTDTDLPYLLKGTALSANCAKMTNTARSLAFKAPGKGTMKLYFMNTTNADAVSIDNGIGEKAVPVGYCVVSFATADAATTYTITPVVKDPEGLPFLFAAVWTPEDYTDCAHTEAKLVKTTQNVGAADGKVWAYCNDDPLCFEMVQVDAPAADEFDVTVAAATNGTVSVDKTKAAQGAEVTITATANSGYEVDTITVTGASGAVSVTGNKFTMPGEAVTVTVTFKTTGTVTPPTVDKTGLTAAITAAEAVDMSGVVVSESGDGADVLTTDKWIAKSVKDAFDAALTTAKAVPATATQEDVDAAKTALETATTDLQTAITNAANGTKAVTAADLAAAITAAKAKLVGITVEDKTPAEVNKGTEFWSTAAKEALEAAIATAEAVDTDNDDLAAALTALNGAVKDFQAAKQVGTKSTSTGGSSSRPSDSRDPGTSTTDPSTTTPSADDVKVEKTETSTKADGTKVTTSKLSNGSTVVTEVTLDGDVSVDVTNKDGEKVVDINVPAEIPAAETKFEDAQDHWAAEAIDRMASLGLVNGVGGNRYDTEGEVTRATLATMLFRFANGAEGKTSTFADVKAGEWYADAIGWAAAAGVVTGYSETAFGPNDQLTREQMAVMLLRFAKLIGMDSSVDADVVASYTDANAINAWAADGMAWCVKNGIINGMGDNTLAPNGSATRAQTATMLDRFIGLLK